MKKVSTNGIRNPLTSFSGYFMNRFSTITRFGLAIAIAAIFLAGRVSKLDLVSVTVAQEAEQQQEPAEAPSEREPLLLEEITVTGARVEKELFDTPVGMNVVDQGKLLREQPRAAAEALRDEPGIWVQKTGHIGGAPIIRGLMAKQILLMVDGVRYNNLNSFGGPNSWMNTIDAAQIERIEVVRGPGSVLYGTDALGGVINVITKRNRRFSEKFQIRPKLFTRYGSVDQSSTGRLELWSSSKRFNFLLGGALKNIGDLRGGRGVGIQTPSSWKEGNFDLRTAVKLSEGHFLDLSYQDFHRYDVTRFDRPGWLATGDREMLSLSYRGRKINPLLSQVKIEAAFHNREDGRKHETRLDNSFRDTETIQTEAQATSLLGGAQRLTYGVHFHHDTAEGWRETKKGRSISPNAKWDNLGVFLQDEISLLGRLWLIPAIRWDWYRIEREKDQTNPKDLGITQKNTALTGSLGVVYGLTDILNVTATVGRGFRAPNNRDYRSAPGLFTFGVGVPTTEILNPEKSTNYEVGLRLKHHRFQGALSAYYMLIDDLIGSRRGTYQGKDWYDWDGDGVHDPDEDVFVTANKGEEFVYGTEAQALVLLNDAWSISGNFTYVAGRNRTEDEPLGRAFPTNGVLKLFWREPKTGKYWAEFSTRLVSRFDADKIPEARLKRDPAFKVNPQDRKSPLLSGDGSVPGYVIFNLRGGVKIAEWTELTFGVENLTDKKYRDKDSRIDAPGLNFVVAWTLKP